MEKLGVGEPQQIGAYRLIGRLGAGGMGHVYLARSERGRTVAVKLVRRELAAQDEFRARFRREVRAARRVGGYWTAPVLDADTEAAVPWVATGYVAGPSLQAVVGHDHGALPERSVRTLAAGLAHALRDIHAAGLIHRDLKPSNVLVTIDGPRVIDFGIARALETVTDGGLTQTGALVGSPGFMAPEQVRGDRITPACDVFCLGSVLAYAATGHLPFGSADSGAHALMFRIAQEEPDLGRLPEGLADLVRDCLRKDPAARPALDQILARTGAEDTVLDGRSRDPWLPSALVAQLGRHAVKLLDTEDPERPEGKGGAAQGAPAGPETPEASPEHAPAAPGERSTPVDRLPTQTVGPGHPPPPTVPPAVTPHPAYGGPQQQHPQPAAYGGYPPGPGYGPYGTAVAPPHTDVAPYPQPRPQPQPPPGAGRSTVVLIVVALVVALGAGGSVYALMQRGDASGSGGDGKVSNASPSAVASTTPGAPGNPGTPESPGPTTPEPSPSTSEPLVPGDGGAIPARFLGTWDAVIDNGTGRDTRRLAIQQGEAGDTVLSLTADGPGYHCVFQAELAEEPAGGGPLVIGPSAVTVGEPATSCTPGGATEVTILPDGSLRRVNTESGQSLTYTRAN